MENEKLLTKSFDTVSRLWLDSIDGKVNASTKYKYSNVVEKHLLPYYKEILVEDISTEIIKDFISEKQKAGMSESMLRIIILVLKNILRFTGNTNQIRFKIKSDLQVDIPKEETQTISKNDVYVIENYILSNVNEMTIAIILSLKMGLQLGEICGLRWQDISLEERKLYVRNIVQRFPDETGKKKTKLVMMPPSGEGMVRSIPIPESVMKCLLKMMDSGYKQNSLFYNAADKGAFFVVTGKKDKLPDPRTIQYRYQKILEAIKISSYKFIALRHTFAFHCLEIGIDMELLSKLMGHSNIKTTITRYRIEKKDEEELQIARFMAG